MTQDQTSEHASAGRNGGNRRTLIVVVVLVVVALPLITIAGVWPTYGAACAVTVAALVAVLQLIHDRR
jgi:fatty acid desaturase